MAQIHVTLLYAGLLGLLLVILSFNMMKSWVRVIGRGEQNDPDLRRAEALIGSFTDYVPLALLLVVGVEVCGAPAPAIHVLGGTLVVARFMHAFGSNRSRGADALRFLGAQLTYLVLTVASFGCLFFYAMPTLVAPL
ncbi:MAG: MAPEG family protein [Bdellovibrionales bacterium]